MSNVKYEQKWMELWSTIDIGVNQHQYQDHAMDVL